jgi:hypothetical protein
MDIEKIRSYLFQGLLVLASMIHSLVPSGTSYIWNLILKLNGGWAQAIPVVAVIVLQIFGWQILRILWFVLNWTFSPRKTKEKEIPMPTSSIVNEVLDVTIRHLMDRIHSLEKSRDRQDDQISYLNDKIFELKEKIASRHD